MIDFRHLIRQELLKEELFVNWLAKLTNNLPNISVNRLTNAVYPCCVLEEIAIVVISSSENTANNYETMWQISLYSKDGTHVKVMDSVNNAMMRLGFRLYYTDEYFTDNSKVVHKILKYSQILDDNEFYSLQNGNLWEI